MVVWLYLCVVVSVCGGCLQVGRAITTQLARHEKATAALEAKHSAICARLEAVVVDLAAKVAAAAQQAAGSGHHHGREQVYVCVSVVLVSRL